MDNWSFEIHHDLIYIVTETSANIHMSNKIMNIINVEK